MDRNVGRLDARIRAFVVAPVLVAAGACVLKTKVGGSTPASAAIAGSLFALAGVALASARCKTCPVYSGLSVSTYSPDEAVEDAMTAPDEPI